MVKFIAEYFRRTTTYSAGRFILEMFLLAIILKVTLLGLISITVIIFESTEFFFFGDKYETDTQFNNFGLGLGLLIFCIIAPLVESIIGQAIPIFIVAFFISRKLIQVIVSSSIFTLFHSIESAVFGIIIFNSGLIFAWCFVAQKDSGFWKAILVTSAVHSLYNFTGFLTFYSDQLILRLQFLIF